MDVKLADHRLGLSIGAMARRTGVSVDTIRYYERLGLLADVDRTVGGHREYGRAHLERLRFIRRCRHLGLHLKQIGTMLAPKTMECGEMRDLLGECRAEVRRRIAELRAIDRELRGLLEVCGDAELTACGLVEALHGETADPAVRCCSARRDTAYGARGSAHGRGADEGNPGTRS